MQEAGGAGQGGGGSEAAAQLQHITSPSVASIFLFPLGCYKSTFAFWWRALAPCPSQKKKKKKFGFALEKLLQSPGG